MKRGKRMRTQKKTMTMRMIRELPVRGMEIPRTTILPLEVIRACGLFGNITIFGKPKESSVIQGVSDKSFFQVVLNKFPFQYTFAAKFSPKVLSEIDKAKKQIKFFDLGETLLIRCGWLTGEVEKLSGSIAKLPDPDSMSAPSFPLGIDEMERICKALRLLKCREIPMMYFCAKSFSFSVNHGFGNCVYVGRRPVIERKKVKREERF